MKYSRLNDIDWDYYHIIGFDMDGTLYKEKIFIMQAYKEISSYLAKQSCKKADEIYEWMFNRWVLKGSSYPFIFSETLEEFHIVNENEKIEKCLDIYRNIQPNLALQQNIVDLLNRLSAQKRLFLVTDGHFVLQKRKFESLQLNRWFKKNDVIFTGELGSHYYKPNVASTKYIDCLKNNGNPVLYFGDREIDDQYSRNAGFDFVKVENFDEFWGVD